jgi:hypothetical protein
LNFEFEEFLTDAIILSSLRFVSPAAPGMMMIRVRLPGKERPRHWHAVMTVNRHGLDSEPELERFKCHGGGARPGRARPTTGRTLPDSPDW